MAGVKLKVLLVVLLVEPPAEVAEPVDAPALEPAATLMMVV